jgi:iron only hydrogenase large subunit-like protein
MVVELTYGAKIVNQHYHEYIKKHYSDYVRPTSKNKKLKNKDKNFQNKFISSACPASVNLIVHSHPEIKNFLMPFDSPMGAMSKIIRKNYPEHKIVFLSPCGAKKVEATTILDKNKNRIIDSVVTFLEMKQILAKEKPVPTGENDFDSFYNNYTKIYPLSGGLSKTLHYKGILEKNEVMNEDGCLNLQKTFGSNLDKVFYDILFCPGGCIGGPGIATNKPIFWRRQKVIAYARVNRKKNPKKQKGTEKYSKGIDFSRSF